MPRGCRSGKSGNDSPGRAHGAAVAQFEEDPMTETKPKKKMGRPPAGAEPKSLQLRLRLSPAEKEALHKAAINQGISVSKFILSTALERAAELDIQKG